MKIFEGDNYTIEGPDNDGDFEMSYNDGEVSIYITPEALQYMIDNRQCI